MSEALILASTNPQYDHRLFIELRVQYMKIARFEHVAYTNWFFWHSEQFMYTTCFKLGIFMDNLLSYYGLVDARISASDKDFPQETVLEFYLYIRQEFFLNKSLKWMFFWLQEAVNQMTESSIIVQFTLLLLL